MEENKILKSKNQDGDGANSWAQVLANIAVAFLVVIFVAVVLLAVEKVVENRLGKLSFSNTPSWLQVLGIKTVQAATLKGFEAMPISGNSQISMKAGETKTVSFGFQNIGSEVWANSGANFISIYTYDPKYRVSSFANSSWHKKDQPALLTEAKVAVNGVGHIAFSLRAPTTTGIYKETFALAAEDKAWIPGGQFTITINVTQTTSAEILSTNSGGVVGSDGANGYSAQLMIKSAKKPIKVGGGETVSFTVGIKNSGTKSWSTRSIKLPEVSVASSTGNYQHSSWADSHTVAVKAGSVVAPGAMDLLSFKFTAPTKKGNYTIKFSLAADSVVVPGGDIEIPVEVTNDAGEVKNIEKNNKIEKVDAENFISEPTLRVGVLIVDDETENKVNITCESAFALKDGNGALLAEMNKNEPVEAFYKTGKYWFNRGKGLESTSFYLRFVPDTANAICTVTNFDRRVTRHSANADNQFRNVLELRYNAPNDRVWLINELPMEYYLRGLAETSNLSHLEFQKTLITAARTYAYYHFERATKHASEFFHVDAYADQVYNGYGQEARTPRLTQAVQETAGYIVTYNNETAITPYFSRSDGRTRDWSEVWGGSVPWCQSVSTPSDQGKKLWGHGVGMSASAALSMANDGEDWQKILKYFYTGIDLIRKWK